MINKQKYIILVAVAYDSFILKNKITDLKYKKLIKKKNLKYANYYIFGIVNNFN
jgi:hypothetical protein